MENSFVDILNSSSKRELISKCKSQKIWSEDFANFIIFCKSGLCRLAHRMQFFDFVPEHLETRESDFDILDCSPAEQASKEGQKAIRRLFKAHGERKYLVGHMFYETSIRDRPEWHFIFFETNELYDRANHWCEGSHVHLVNHLWPNMQVDEVWNDFVKNRHFPKTKVHIRYHDRERKHS